MALAWAGGGSPIGVGDADKAVPAAAWPAPRHAAAHAVEDLRAAHQLAHRSTVLVTSPLGEGAGWIAELDGTRLVVTNRHVVQELHGVRVHFSDGSEDLGLVVHRSRTIDVALVVVSNPIPIPPLPMARGGLMRGERVVLGGHPGGMHFITSEGVIAGAAAGLVETDRACGVGRNCVVIDAETHFGNSGGPVVDRNGNCLGMVWGGVRATSFTLAVHAETMAEELSRVESRLREFRGRLRRYRPD